MSEKKKEAKNSDPKSCRQGYAERAEKARKAREKKQFGWGRGNSAPYFMEILKRAKNGCEVVAWNESKANVREEVNKRTCKAGYTNAEGGPPATGRIIIMPPNDKYRKNYDKIKW